MKGMSKVIIYGLVDPRSNKLFYVGSTKNLDQRIRLYLLGGDRGSSVRSTICQLIDCGLRFKVRIIETVDAVVRDEREGFWIAKYRSDGEPLVNRRNPTPRRVK